jgi:hypothetical protein
MVLRGKNRRIILKKVYPNFPGETFRVLKEKEGYVQIQEESSGA